MVLNPFRALSTKIICATATFFPLATMAQDDANRVLKNPPKLSQELEINPKGRLTALAPSASSTSDEVVYELDIDLIEKKIWNLATPASLHSRRV